MKSIMGKIGSDIRIRVLFGCAFLLFVSHISVIAIAATGAAGQ